MGQAVGITQKRTLAPGVVRYELNRSLTGTAHESYRSAADADGARPTDVLARRLFESGVVEAVHVFSNVVTITLIKTDQVSDSLDGIVEDLFLHYLPGVLPAVV
jgi:hypothetical protein